MKPQKEKNPIMLSFTKLKGLIMTSLLKDTNNYRIVRVKVVFAFQLPQRLAGRVPLCLNGDDNEAPGSSHTHSQPLTLSQVLSLIYFISRHENPQSLGWFSALSLSQISPTVSESAQALPYIVIQFFFNLSNFRYFPQLMMKTHSHPIKNYLRCYIFITYYLLLNQEN